MSAAEAPASKSTEYRGKTPRAGRAFAAWRMTLLWGTTLGFLGSVAGLAYLVLFTHPSAGHNLLVIYVLAAFGSFFGLWSPGYWVRLKFIGEGEHPRDTWPCTRQAFLGAAAIIISLLLMRIDRFGVPAVILLASGVVVAETSITWLSARE